MAGKKSKQRAKRETWVRTFRCHWCDVFGLRAEQVMFVWIRQAYMCVHCIKLTWPKGVIPVTQEADGMVETYKYLPGQAD